MRTKHPELGMCGFLEYYKKKKTQTFRIRILWALRIIYYFSPRLQYEKTSIQKIRIVCAFQNIFCNMRNKPELSRQGGAYNLDFWDSPYLLTPPSPHPTCFHLNHWDYLLSPQKLCQVPKARAQFHGRLTGPVQ
jgi:hypothetical protein